MFSNLCIDVRAEKIMASLAVLQYGVNCRHFKRFSSAQSNEETMAKFFTNKWTHRNKISAGAKGGYIIPYSSRLPPYRGKTTTCLTRFVHTYIINGGRVFLTTVGKFWAWNSRRSLSVESHLLLFPTRSVRPQPPTTTTTTTLIYVRTEFMDFLQLTWL